MSRFIRSIYFSIPFFALAFSLMGASPSHAREQIRIVGSSTVYPFVAAAAEQFGRGAKFKTPIVESTGTGGGLKLFCEGQGENTPDIVNASREIKRSERERCAENGVTEVVEVPIGFDGIVIAHKNGVLFPALTREQIFLALARELPRDGKLVANPYRRWSEIAPSLPDSPIEVYGPPPTSGTRDAFVEMVMEETCEAHKAFAAAVPDPKERKQKCGLLREDGAYIDAGEDDNVIVQKLTQNEKALGVLGYGFMMENASKVQGATVDGIAPTFDNIASGEYPVSRKLYIYVKKQHVGQVPGVAEFVRHLTSGVAAGEEGYLVDKGMIPLTPQELKKTQEAAKSL